MKIIALEQEIPTVESGDFARFSQDEARQAWKLQQAGFIREIYFRADQNCAVLILEAESVERAHRQLQALPLVKNGLIQFELIPLKAYPGFERLFK